MTADVLDALAKRGVQSVLLKGPVLAGWLYADGSPRSYLDTDLLVAPDQTTRAEAGLRALGFEEYLDESDMPGRRLHAYHWNRASDGASVDLHRTLIGVRADDALVWQALSAETDEIRICGIAARTLAPAGRALHLALHAAQHGRATPQPLEDLERGLLLGDLDFQVWAAAADLAERLGATQSFAAGLRLVPSGARLASELSLPFDRSVETTLRAASARAGALGWHELARTQGWSATSGLIMRKLVPSRRYMRATLPIARRGRRGMLAAYVIRPPSVAYRAVSSFGTWQRARQSSRLATTTGNGRRTANESRQRALDVAALLPGTIWTMHAAAALKRQLKTTPIEQLAPPPSPPYPYPARAIALGLKLGRHTCLTSALIAQAWRATTGESPDVIIGVRSITPGFFAHAWLDDHDPSHASRFSEIIRLRRAGDRFVATGPPFKLESRAGP